MSTIRPIARHLLIIRLALFVATVATGHAQTDEQLDRALHWRNIGPHRGGRTRAVAGVPSKPNLFYMAQVNGGVFRSTDYGRTWDPIFDDQPTGSIGALAVSLSNPEIIYAGSGEGLHRPDLSVGDGIYKSTNGGTSWEHLGLRDGQQIAQIAIDPTNPDRVFVAVSGHPYGPNEERGIFRSTDGGKTFEKVLSKDENTGGADVQINPAHPEIVYASLWESREGPWENAKWDGDNGGIFKSIDGGKTWKQLGGGLPVPMVQVARSIARTTAARPGRSQPPIDARPTESAAATCPSFASIQGIRRRFTRPVSSAGNQLMAGKPGAGFAARPAAMIIRTFGSILTTPTSFC
jgi:hypothetical protein